MTSLIQSRTLALECLLDQGINSGNVADQFLWESVANFQIGDAGRTHPDPIIFTLPDEHFEGQIKCQKWGSYHQWSASFRAAKDQHMGLLHLETDSFRFCTMVNLISLSDIRHECHVCCLPRLRERSSAHIGSGKLLVGRSVCFFRIPQFAEARLRKNHSVADFLAL